MRKSAWLMMLFFLSSCALPFSSQQAAPELVIPTTTALVTGLQEPVVAIPTQEPQPAVECPECHEIPPEYLNCESALSNCVDTVNTLSPVITQMAATIEVMAASGIEAMPNMTETAAVAEAMPTPTATASPDALLPTLTVDALPPTPAGFATYRADAVVYKQNFAYPDKGCNWLGIAGQVLGASGNPTLNLVVVAEGELQGQKVLQLDITGLHNAYGPGGYELTLGSQVVASSNMIFVTIYNLEGEALTSSIPIVTRADCQQNLLILNFQQSP